MVRKFNRFGRGGCYECRRCHKQTRDTGEGEASVELCARCLEIEGQRNSHTDNGFTVEQHNSPLCPVCHPELEVVPRREVICSACGGSRLAPTRGGVPRGSCHCPDHTHQEEEMSKKQKRDHGTAENPQPVTYTIPEPETPQAAEAPKAEVKVKTPKPIAYEPSGEIKAAKVGSKLAALIDALAAGATMDELVTVLSATGSPVDQSGVRSWIGYDLKRTGLGVRQGGDRHGDRLYLVGTPLPHREAGVKAPEATTLKVERGSAKVRKAAMRPPKKAKASR